MAETLSHRGPDDDGYYVANGIGLGMRRLSIIDVAGGHQPIFNEDESVWIVCNGEIYNYQQLLEEVLKKGHRLRTRSDTEVILHLYEDYGPQCLNLLDGMFAFAIYDDRRQVAGETDARRKGRLLIGRDRLGKKPLYYADLHGTLLFASEIKAILQHEGVSKELDFDALSHYLSLQVIPTPYTIFKAIRKLPGGCFLQCDHGGVSIHRYWDYLNYVGHQQVAEQEAVGKIRELLFDAVGKRLMAEVPLGAFLSGGLDSGAVVAIMRQIKGEPVETFSIGFEGPATHNELPYARALAAHFHTRHHEFMVQPDIVEAVQEVVRFADEPFAISAAIPTLLLSRAAREFVTVVLTGDGGDEIFGGYSQYLLEDWSSAYRRLPAMVDHLVKGTAHLLPASSNTRLGRWRSRIDRFTAIARQSVGQRRLGYASSFSESDKDRLCAFARGNGSTAGLLEARTQTAERLDPALQQNFMDILVWLPDEMLTKVDRMTMAASVEARCPLLDWKLVEYAASLSLTMKIPGRRAMSLKHLLRRAVADLLPPWLLKRPKWGFNVPLDVWFRGDARPYLEAVLSPQRIRRRGLFKPEEVASLLARHQARQTNASNRLYALLVFEVWAETYL